MGEVVPLPSLACLRAPHTLRSSPADPCPAPVRVPSDVGSVPHRCPLTSLYSSCFPFNQCFNLVFAPLVTWKSSRYLVWVLRHGHHGLP